MPNYVENVYKQGQIVDGVKTQDFYKKECLLRHDVMIWKP